LRVFGGVLYDGSVEPDWTQPVKGLSAYSIYTPVFRHKEHFILIKTKITLTNLVTEVQK